MWFQKQSQHYNYYFKLRVIFKQFPMSFSAEEKDISTAVDRREFSSVQFHFYRGGENRERNRQDQ